jgi:curved DNA-binding protein CbpA
MNPFTRLGLEQRLTLSEAELREAFRSAGKSGHPDAGGSGDDFALLQDAFTRLSSPSRRLRCWLEAKGLTGEERGAISPALLDLFSIVGAALQQADAVTKRREAALSALAKAMLEPSVQQARESLEAALDQVSKALQTEEARFPELEAGRGDPWLVARDLAFLEKWQAELKSRFAGLW